MQTVTRTKAVSNKASDKAEGSSSPRLVRNISVNGISITSMVINFHRRRFS